MGELTIVTKSGPPMVLFRTLAGLLSAWHMLERWTRWVFSKEDRLGG